MCDIFTRSISENDEDAQLRKQFHKEVLDLKFNELPKSKITRVLDEHPDTVIEVALELGFSKGTIDDMTDKQFGGGQPHARFIDLLKSKSFSIGDVKDAMIKAGINEDSVKEKFLIAEEKNYYYFNECTPKEIMPFSKLVREDIYNCNQPSWKHVAEELGMSDVIPLISQTRTQGGMYSIGKAFCGIITFKNLTIKKFKELLDNQLNRRREDGESTIVIEKICDMYVKAIEDKVEFKLRAYKQEKERENRRIKRYFSCPNP